MNLKDRAVFTALWIGEVKPDFFSRIIQLVLRTNYSHNAILYNGEIWHGTVSDNEKYDGFCNEPIERALEGSVVRYCKDIPLSISNETFIELLRFMKGADYSQRLNLLQVNPWLDKVPILRWFFRPGKFDINCSKALAMFCKWSEYKFEKPNKVKPTDTWKKIKPDACVHNHIISKTQLSKEDI